MYHCVCIVLYGLLCMYYFCFCVVMGFLLCMHCFVCISIVMYVLLLHYTLAGTRKIASQLPLVKCLCHQPCYFQHLSIQHGSLCCTMQRITKFIEMHSQIHSPHVSKHVKTSSEPAQ